MTSLTFNCPICKNQMKQIHFGKGRPNIKLEFDLGDGTLGTTDVKGSAYIDLLLQELYFAIIPTKNNS
jgi:hypothetical protein